MLTAHVADKYQSNFPMIVMHETEALNAEARLACTLVERWGMVAGADAGEDSQGRSKGRLLSPNEVVDRACETAELMLKNIRERGWTVPIPTWDEAKQQAAGLRRQSEDEEEAARINRAADRAASRSPK